MTTTTADLASLAEIDVNSGLTLVGRRVRDDKFLTLVPFFQLYRMVRDPLRAETPRKGDRPTAEDVAYAELRNAVQRAVTGGKEKNVKAYRDYLVKVMLGLKEQRWSTPPITLYSAEPLQVTPYTIGFGLQTQILSVPDGSNVVAIDGETQYLALRSIHADPGLYGVTREQIRDWPVAIEVYHGMPVAAAQQIFHDRNTLEVKPDANTSMNMDQNDPGTRIVRHLMERITVEAASGNGYEPLATRIETSRRQISAKSGRWITMTGMRAFAVCVVLGTPGMNAKNGFLDPALMPALPEDEINAEVQKIMELLLRNFAGELSAYKGMMSRVATMAAIGAVAHRCMSWYTGPASLSRQGLVELLAGVQWSPDLKSQSVYWEGVSGKASKTGLVSSEGVKRFGRQIQLAIEQPDSEMGRKIRGSVYTGGSTESAYSD